VAAAAALAEVHQLLHQELLAGIGGVGIQVPTTFQNPAVAPSDTTIPNHHKEVVDWVLLVLVDLSMLLVAAVADL
jgi:hypothetical protein